MSFACFGGCIFFVLFFYVDNYVFGVRRVWLLC